MSAGFIESNPKAQPASVLGWEVTDVVDPNQLSFPFTVDSVSMTVNPGSPKLPSNHLATKPDESFEVDILNSHTPIVTQLEDAVSTDASTFGQQAELIAPASIGQRLRAAREVRDWSVEEVSAKLHVPLSVVQALETDTYQRIEGVYLRGYLQSYLRLLDLSQSFAETVVAEYAINPPPLVTTGTISHSRYLFQRYSVPAVYLILTGLIAVPAVWLATHGGLEQNLARVAPLDSPTLSELQDSALSSTEHRNSSENSQSAVGNAATSHLSTDSADNGSHSVQSDSESPLVASMALFPKRSLEALQGNLSPTGNGHNLRFRLRENSWVEVLDSNGQRLQYGLLAAGSVHEYSSDRPLQVRLGNVSGTIVEVDGEVVDIAAYRHANIARFKVFSGDEKVSRPD